MPLSAVKDKVLEYLGNWREKVLQRANEGITKYEKEGNETMLGCYLLQKGNIICDTFTWYSAVYDVESESNSVPDCPDGYWSVVVDMHS